MSVYSKIFRKMWVDSWFINLQPIEKLVWIYLLSPPVYQISGLVYAYPETIQKHIFPAQNNPKNKDNPDGSLGVSKQLKGCFELVSNELNSCSKDVSNELNSRSEFVDFRFQICSILQKFATDKKIIWDENNGVIFIPNALKYNRPENPNQAKSWIQNSELIPDCFAKNQWINSIENLYPTRVSEDSDNEESDHDEHAKNKQETNKNETSSKQDRNNFETTSKQARNNPVIKEKREKRKENIKKRKERESCARENPPQLAGGTPPRTPPAHSLAHAQTEILETIISDLSKHPKFRGGKSQMRMGILQEIFSKQGRNALDAILWVIQNPESSEAAAQLAETLAKFPDALAADDSGDRPRLSWAFDLFEAHQPDNEDETLANQTQATENAEIESLVAAFCGPLPIEVRKKRDPDLEQKWFKWRLKAFQMVKGIRTRLGPKKANAEAIRWQKSHVMSDWHRRIGEESQNPGLLPPDDFENTLFEFLGIEHEVTP